MHTSSRPPWNLHTLLQCIRGSSEVFAMVCTILSIASSRGHALYELKYLLGLNRIQWARVGQMRNNIIPQP